MSKITATRVSWTAGHEQYWQGHGVAMTEYTHCATGVGETLREAFEAALDQFDEMGFSWQDVNGRDDMLADLTAQVKEPSMLDWDIVQGYCDCTQSDTPREDFDYRAECGYYHCGECDKDFYPMELAEESKCPECLDDATLNLLGVPECAVCAGEWHYYVSIDVELESEVAQ